MWKLAIAALLLAGSTSACSDDDDSTALTPAPAQAAIQGFLDTLASTQGHTGMDFAEASAFAQTVCSAAADAGSEAELVAALEADSSVSDFVGDGAMAESAGLAAFHVCAKQGERLDLPRP